MSEYSIEKGGPAGLYLINHLFDQRHGIATIGYVRKNEDGKWSSECREVKIEGSTKSRTDAADKVFDYWKENFSKEALTKMYGNKTKGGHQIEFIHGGVDWIVAAVSGKMTDKRVKTVTTWKDGIYTMADEKDGKRDDSFDLVRVAPDKKLEPASEEQEEISPPKKASRMRP